MALWQLCSATDWAHLPRAGGWLDQDDAFLHDAMLISRRLRVLRLKKRLTKKAHDDAARKMGIGN